MVQEQNRGFRLPSKGLHHINTEDLFWSREYTINLPLNVVPRRRSINHFLQHGKLIT